MMNLVVGLFAWGVAWHTVKTVPLFLRMLLVFVGGLNVGFGIANLFG